MSDHTRDPLGRLTENLFTLQRIGNTISGTAQEFIDALFEEIANDLRRIDPTAPSAERWKKYRTDQFIAEVERRIREAFPAWEGRVRDGLAVAGRAQGVFAENLLVASLGASDAVTRTPVTQNMIRAILTSDPFEGALLSEWREGLGAATVRRVRQQVRIGMASEEPITEIVRRIRGRRVRGAASGFTGGVYQTTTRDAEAIVRTAVNFVSNRAHRETFRANKEIIAGYRFVSVIDDRTSVLCGSLDQTMWTRENDVRWPPLHVNCRSQVVVEPAWDKLGLEPPPDGERFVRDLSGVSEEDLGRKVSARRRTDDLGKRQSVSSSTTFSDWLKRQPNYVQERVLKSPTRAKLFREGRVSLKDLVTKDGNIIPLDRLET